MNLVKKGLRIFQDIEVVISIIIIVGIVGLRVLGFVPYAVKTGSMEPTIHTGSLTYVDTHYDVKKIKEKDIIAFKLSDDLFVTHRVAEVHDDYFVTKGDANNTVDNRYVYDDEIIGKVVFSIPYLGMLSTAVDNNNFKFTVGIIVTIIVLNIVISLVVSDSKKEKNLMKGND
jgi:signal peptidase